MIGVDQWARPWWLVTPEGTLLLNNTAADTFRRFQLAPLKCNANLPVRVTQDDVPQGDGAIPHRRWRSGFSVHLAIELIIDPQGDGDDMGPEGTQEPACDEDLVAMVDLLGLHVNAMIRTGLVSGFPNARLFWTPSGETSPTGDRMFDRCQLNTGGTVSEGDLGGTLVEFDVDTPYPYYIEATETDTVLGDSGVEVITNVGNTQYFPVVRVDGPTSNFILLNDSVVDLDGNPLEILYDDSLPGANPIASTHYLEINFFTGQAFDVAPGGALSNFKAGIDMRYSDFWPIVPGDNLIACIGATATVLSNGAWA